MDGKADHQTTHRLLVMTGLCMLAVICNVMLPGMFWDSFIPQRDFVKSIMFVAMGALVAEVCLLGIWCGLSQQPIKYRLPVTASLVLVGVCSYNLGLQLPEWGSRSAPMPIEAALVIAGAAFAMFALMQVPLWLIRRSTQRRISTAESAPFGESQEGRQFSIGYLMLWTALAGLLLFLFRNTLPEDSAGISLRGLVEIVLALLVYTALSSLLCIPCVWIVLIERPQLGAVLLLAGALIAGPFVVLAGTIMIFGGQDAGELLAGVPCFEIGLSGTTLVGLLVLRSLGYRLLVVG